MNSKLTIYGDMRSGNCLKVKWVVDFLRLPYQWIETRAGTGATKDPAFLTLNPQGQVPVLVLGDGRVLAQSNAIVLHLAEATPLTPDDSYERARMWEAMFWEQYSHEPAIAVRRWRLHFLGMPETDLDPSLLDRGRLALELMEDKLATQAWIACNIFTCADIALLAYTRMANEGGFNLASYPHVSRWITRCESRLALGPYVSAPRQIPV
jgi:glutathione S-transferase